MKKFLRRPTHANPSGALEDLFAVIRRATGRSQLAGQDEGGTSPGSTIRAATKAKTMFSQSWTSCASMRSVAQGIVQQPLRQGLKHAQTTSLVADVILHLSGKARMCQHKHLTRGTAFCYHHSSHFGSHEGRTHPFVARLERGS